MRNFIANYQALKIVFILALISNIALWLLAIFAFPRNQSTAVLHYNIDVGVDFIGEGRQIVILPIAGLVILIGNTLLGLVLLRADISSSWIVWGIIPIIQIVLIGAFFLIRQANY